RGFVRELLEEPLAERFPGLVRVAFAPHRSADDPSGARRRRGRAGRLDRVLARSARAPSLAPPRGVAGGGGDGHVPDLLRGDERGVRARGPFGFGGPGLARSMGGLALGAHRARGARVLRSTASTGGEGMTPTILVTGATGTNGRLVVQALLGTGAR